MVNREAGPHLIDEGPDDFQGLLQGIAAGLRARCIRGEFDLYEPDAVPEIPELVDSLPTELHRTVGYFGPPAGAAAALSRLAQGLDEAMVRIITVRPGDLDACLATVRACAPGGMRGSRCAAAAASPRVPRPARC